MAEGGDPLLTADGIRFRHEYVLGVILLALLFMTAVLDLIKPY